MNFIKRLKISGAVFLAAALVILGGAVSFKAGVSATESSDVSSSHYLAFTSDVHGQNSKLDTAFLGMPSTVEYVGLIGDMAGEGGGAHPEYNSSDLLAIAKSHFSGIDSSSAAIVWADHDISVHDDANIVKIWNGFESAENGYNSGEILKTADYYVYVIGYYHMLKGGDISKTAAQEFKDWVNNIEDKTKPIIVLGHVPLVAKRGDNNGATYWNEALNYAATGVEGLDDAAKTAEVTRNVFYFYGHNHTVDATEYYYAPGGVMNVQIDTTVGTEEQLSASGVTVKTINSTDTELGSVTAKGVDVNVFYNALITGYIKTSGNATLMEIGEKAISLTKYNNGEKVSLGTDGTTGETLAETLKITRISAPEDPEDSDDSDDSSSAPLVPNSGRQ